ncbi:MAG TPA: hypothetical protein VHS09_00185 [Polyangiaceae bacterium]|nr:hypothetical protein [Polyangiaceae bacterium]
MHSRRRPALVALALLATTACKHAPPAPAGGASLREAPSASATPAASSSAAGTKAFGAFCVEDGECAAAVCFHKRIKTAGSGPERRGGGDALEHDGYCSIRCSSDADCPTPPSNGRCGARGMCKRPE